MRNWRKKKQNDVTTMKSCEVDVVTITITDIMRLRTQSPSTRMQDCGCNHHHEDACGWLICHHEDAMAVDTSIICWAQEADHTLIMQKQVYSGKLQDVHIAQSHWWKIFRHCFLPQVGFAVNLPFRDKTTASCDEYVILQQAKLLEFSLLIQKICASIDESTMLKDGGINRKVT